MKNFCLLALMVVVCAGCVNRTPIYYSTSFDQAQWDRLQRLGRNTVIVNGFTRDRYDDRILTCAGYKAFLYPVTERSSEYINIIYGSPEGGQKSVSNVIFIESRIADQEPGFTGRTVTCDSDGFAVFEKVGDGEFYVTATSDGFRYAGKVRVKGGETKKVVLSGLSVELAHPEMSPRYNRY